MTSINEIPDDPLDFRYKEEQQHEQKEFTLLKNVMRNPKLSILFKSLKSQFESNLGRLALAKNSSGVYLMDNFSPLEILKLFNGLEIHYIQKAFNQLENLSFEGFIILSLRILGIKSDEAPYALLGLSNLYHSLVTKRNKKKLVFQDFLNSFLKIQSLSNETRIFVDEGSSRPRFANSSNHDKFHHDNPIKNAFFSISLQLIFCLDEVSDHLRIYNAEAMLIKKIMPDKNKHLHNGDVFIDFAWAENIKMIAAIYQDSRLGFFYESDKFTLEEVYVTKTLQYKIWYIPFCKFFLTCDTFNKLYLWNEKAKEHTELLAFPFKISDVSGVDTFNVIAIATFDRKVTLWDIKQKMVFMVINLEDSSAHTIKYSVNQNVLFVSTFDRTVKVYALDIAKDYTLRGKLEHGSSITSMELCDADNLVITCDDKANIKTWDTRNFRNVQSSKLQTLNHPNKIVHLSGSTRFCVLTNRLHFYAFTDTKSMKASQLQVTPQILFDPANEEIIIGTASDIRVFDMRYGVLAELYDHEMYNIKNRTVYLQRSKKQDKIFFSDEFGEIKQLEYYSTYKKQEEMRKNNQLPGFHKAKKFQPFECENTNFLFDDRNDLLTTWRDNHLHIYRFEENGAHGLIRSLVLPNDCIITGCRIFRSEWILATTINNSYVMFWEYKKLQLKGILTCDSNEPENINRDDQKTSITKRTTRTRFTKIQNSNSQKSHIFERKNSRRQSIMTNTPKHKNSMAGDNSFISPKLDASQRQDSGVQPTHQKSDSILNFNLLSNGKSIFASPNIKKDEVWSNFLSMNKNEDDHNSDIDSPHNDRESVFPAKIASLKEITDLAFVKGSSALIVLDEYSEIFLVHHDRFEHFKSRTRLKIENRPSSISYEILKIQVKSMNISKMVNEKVIDPESSKKLFSTFSREEPIEYICIMADTDHKITIFNLKSIILERFPSDFHDNTIVNPHYIANITFDKNFFDSLFNKYKKQNSHCDCVEEAFIPASKIIKWKAHAQTIINFKLINYSGLLLISMSEDNTLKIWTIEGVQLCNLFLNDLRKTMWNIQQDTDAKRKYTYERLKEKIVKIYNKFETDIDVGYKTRHATTHIFDDEKGNPEEEEEQESPIEYHEDEIVNSRSRKEYTNFMAKYMLDRDKEIFNDSPSLYGNRPMVTKLDPPIDKKSIQPSPTFLTPQSNYTIKLAQRLEEVVKKQPEKVTQSPEFPAKGYRGSRFGQDLLNARGFVEKKSDFAAQKVAKKPSLNMPSLNIPKTKDYQEYYKMGPNDNSKYIYTDTDSSLNPGNLSNSTRFESTNRGKFRKNILVNLENQRKLSKNANASIIHRPLPKPEKLSYSQSEKIIPVIDSISYTIDSKDSYYSSIKHLPSLDEAKKIGLQTLKSQTDDRLIVDRATKKLQDLSDKNKRFKILDSLESKRFNLRDELKYMPMMDAEIETKLNSLQTMISHLEPNEQLADLNKQIEDLRKSRKKKIQKRLESITYIPD